MKFQRCSLSSLLLLGCLVQSVLCCGPGRGGIRRRGARKLTPLVYKQHVPNYSERSLAASGLHEGSVGRNNERFRDLVPNYNPDIIFKDEEGTGADRLMTERCKEKLNTLSISVLNQWPGVRLRVTEAWDEDFHHADQSLHYEGRAVDITTSDRDRRKYGMLARLAVESGFDWVYYESRSHIHASCKSEISGSSTSGGCFRASSTVLTSSGRTTRMDDLKIGEEVLTVNSAGNYEFSPVVAFLDRDADEWKRFYTLHLEDGTSLSTTQKHLIYLLSAADEGSNEIHDDVYSRFQPTFAHRAEIGDWLLTRAGNGALSPSRIVQIELEDARGVFAPLTTTGTVLVDKVLASCYAEVESQSVAHAAMSPLRWAKSLWREKEEESQPTPGVHWYAGMLYKIATLLGGD